MNFLLGVGGPVRPNVPPHLMDEAERAAALVEKATSDILLQVDWAAMMEVVDATNNASDQAVKREIVRQIRKRLQSRSTRVVHMALELIEAVVKNGNNSVHREVATPKFMNSMARVARTYAERTGKENLEVADKALEVVQSWGETFLPESHAMPLFAELYHQLRREGLPFRKQYDETKVPVLTPPPSAPSMRGGGGGGTQFGFDGGAGAGGGSLDLSESSVGGGGGGGGGMAGLAPAELLERAGAGEGMLREILHSARSREELMNHEALPQVLAQCQRLARALQQGIEARVGAGAADFLEEFFAANDGLQAALQLYTGAKDRKVLLPLPAPGTAAATGSSAAGPAAAPAAAAEEEEDLDDFLSASTSAAAGKAAASAATAATPAPASTSRTPTPTAMAEVPRLAPSRRDSFDKQQQDPARRSQRESFRRRSGSGGAGGAASVGSDFLLDVASLDISDAGSVSALGSAPGVAKPASAAAAFGSNNTATSSITEAPEFKSTGPPPPHLLPADPFASAPPVPILPPPRSIASPSTSASASAFLSAPGNMTTAGAFPAAFGGGQPQAPQPPPQQQQAQLPAYASMGGVSASGASGGYYGGGGQQQPAPLPAQPWGGPDPFAQPVPPTGGAPPQQPATATSSQNPFDLF